MKKLLSLFLAIIILALSLPLMSVLAQSEDPDLNYGKKILSQRANSESLLKLYDYFVESWQTLGQVSYPADLDLQGDDYSLVAEMAYSDHPECFWAVHSSLPMYYNFDAVGGLDLAKKQFDRATAELTQGLEGKSDYEKAKIIHNRLCKTVTYDFSQYNQTPYGAIVQGVSVCNGYARAYQHLLKSVGIPAWFVTGETKGGGHAWNIVKLDGKWYYTDTTWDDNDMSALGGYDYRYFNITFDQISQDHTLDEIFVDLVPEANSADASYSVAENLNFDKFDFNKLAVALAADEDHKVKIKVNGDANEFVNQFYEQEAAIAKYLNAIDYKTKVLWEYKHDELTGIIIDFDITTACTHSYTDDCDATCNDCTFIREVSNHIYSDTCDKSCSNCGGLRVISHQYDNINDNDCNVCGQKRDPRNWQITVTETDAYTIKPNITINGFTASDITVYDNEGNMVNYNHGYNAFPLKKNQTYTVTLNVDYSDVYDGFEFNAYKICYYHFFDNALDNSCSECGYIREIAGDINQDGETNNKDYALLMQYLNGWEVEISTDVSDVNGDGNIDNKDYALLMQALNGWDVELK